MPDFNVRSDSVNVEQIMDQIRARIREKRGVDYTEQQIREMAAVKLEKFIDPRGVRSDLIEQFRQAQESSLELPNYEFEDTTLFETHRAPIRWLRALLKPILKLFFNPNPLIQALNIQSRLNAHYAQGEALYFELLHNLVIETTRMGIEIKNLKMRVESLSSRLEFNERRARALESAVVYKPSREAEPPSRPAQQVSSGLREQPRSQPPAFQGSGQGAGQGSGQGGQPGQGSGQATTGPEGPGQRSRRRRRRRGRRGGGAPAAVVMGGSGGVQGPVAGASSSGEATGPAPEAPETATGSAERSPARDAPAPGAAASPERSASDGADTEQ